MQFTDIGFEFGIPEASKPVVINGQKAIITEMTTTKKRGEFTTVQLTLIIPTGIKIDDAIRQPQVITAVEEKLRQITYED